MPPDRDGHEALQVSDNADQHRLELVVDGHTAFLVYERRPNSFVLAHTEVPEALRGRRLGERLVQAALDTARAEGRRIIVLCPFARAYLRRHPEVAPDVRIPPDE
jgi:predicted GNAT family acetyltransferase